MSIHWIILFAAVAIGLQGWGYRKLARRRLSYKRSFSKDKVFAGEQIEMVEEIQNDKLLPLPWVRLESMMPSALRYQAQSNLDIHAGEQLQNHKSLFVMKPYSRIVRKHRITCMKRGVHRLDSVTLTAGDLFGITETYHRMKLGLEVVVFPRLLPIDQIPFSNKSWIGDITVRRWILDDPFWKTGARPYAAGDSLRSVHWKASARTNQLQVHQNDYTADRKLQLLVNVQTSESMWNKVTFPETVERALSYAASIAALTIEQGVPTGFSCNAWMEGNSRGTAVQLAPAAGPQQLQTMLELMAHIEMEMTTSIHAVLEQQLTASAETDLLIITPLPMDASQALIHEYRKRGVSIEILHVPVESKRASSSAEEVSHGSA